MIEPWFPEHYAWIFGTSIGVLGGITGSLIGILAPRGRAKYLVFGLYWTVLLASVICLFAGIVALINGQPYGVWYGLSLAGLIGTLVLGLNYPNISRAYRAAEERQMAAQHL